MSKQYHHQAAIITISDKASQGLREDKSGPVLKELLQSAGINVIQEGVVPDEVGQIKAELIRICDKGGISLILTSGGTGLSPRDVTPEATLEVIERQVPGLAEAMRLEGLKHTKHAMLTRAVAGIRGGTLIINLPGSPKGAKENLESVLPALGHGLDKLCGDPSDCARL
jgi:molybdopterin adenylyltransferase